jgi:CubicO group peptidase (beta-lactamase class C family)
VCHGRLPLEDAIRIAREEMLFFRTGGKFSRGAGSRTAAVPWHELWSPVAYRVWVLLISSATPSSCINFATELLLPFTISSFRAGSDPTTLWNAVASTNPSKFSFSPRVQLIDGLYAACLSPAVLRHALERGAALSAVPLEDRARAQAAALVLACLDPVPFASPSDFAGRVKQVLYPSALPPGRWLLAAARPVSAGGGVVFQSGVAGLDAEKDRVQIASLSKPIGSAFALEYFSKRNISLSTGVAGLLRRLNSPFVLEAAPGCRVEWVDEVTLELLMCHSSGIGQHYVHSFRVAEVPDFAHLMEGLTTDLGGQYKKIMVERRPDTSFAYSGGSFILLQYILELMERKPINEIVAPFLAALGMQPSARLQDDGSGPLLPGSINGKLVDRRVFPGIAAGAVCSAGDTLQFLRHLVAA